MRLGILGGGQLGRMIALAGYPLGVRTTVLDPSAEACAAQVCPQIRGEFDDLQALYQLAQASDVVTFEFENVPVESVVLKGLDSLLSIGQMPGGIPVATMAIGKAGAKNAGLFAAAILAGKYPFIRDALLVFRAKQTQDVLDSQELQKAED